MLILKQMVLQKYIPMTGIMTNLINPWEILKDLYHNLLFKSHGLFVGIRGELSDQIFKVDKCKKSSLKNLPLTIRTKYNESSQLKKYYLITERWKIK